MDLDYERGFLVELGSAPIQWWTGKYPNDFTAKSSEAMRFARFEDAERARCYLVAEGWRQGCRSLEHLWSIDSPVSGAPLSELQNESRSPDGDGPGISSAGRDYVPPTGNEAEPRLAMVSERHLKQVAGSEPADSLPAPVSGAAPQPADKNETNE